MTNLSVIPQPIQQINQIDMNSHAVIEASAGTGKTYTIEHLVVSLLLNMKVQSLDEILVVTFTEKAAGELRERIRTIITETIKKDSTELLRISLDNFDSASIFTIHGFCNKILQEYAFENNEQFQNELVDDKEIYRRQLTEIMRHSWPALFGKMLPSILALSHFPDISGHGISRWEKDIIDIAIRYQAAANDILKPTVVSDIVQSIKDAEKYSAAIIEKLIQQVGSINEVHLPSSALCIRYAELNLNKNSMRKRMKLLIAVIKLLVLYKNNRYSLLELVQFFSDIDLNGKNFEILNSGWNKQGSDIMEKFPELLIIIDKLNLLLTIDIPFLQHQLAVQTIIELKELATQYKKTHGLISYDDMINYVYIALSSNSGNLKKILQNRYRYALVDEFQDTDMLQWKIFKTIFLEAPQNKLFIIGDPKQAIYGFRGADINAYYLARNEMIAIYKANYYSLIENWRSTPELINLFNKLFTDNNWFTDTNIQYVPNIYPTEKSMKVHDNTIGLTIVNCGLCSGTEAKNKFAHFIGYQTSKLLKDHNASLAPHDIVILVKKWSEAEAVERALQRANIRYSYYKKEGLFQSKEALELYYLLNAIAHPFDSTVIKKALLTRFFQIPMNMLQNYDNVIPDHPIAKLLKKWRTYAENKNWALLFQSLMEDSGIVYRADMNDYDRMIINYKTIIQNLQITAYENNYNIQRIVDHLNFLWTQDSFIHESYNLERIDMESPGVQIMTMHISKGLQFKIVFIAGGFTQKDIATYWTYHCEHTRVFDLMKDIQSKNLYDDELASEDERLFYVALTRAHDQIYIPIFEPRSASKNSCGILGKKIPQAMHILQKHENCKFIDFDTIPNYTISDNSMDETNAINLIIPEPLFTDPSMAFLTRKRDVNSFSVLKAQLSLNEKSFHTSYQYGITAMQSGEDDSSISIITHSDSLLNKETDDLPHSKETGLMLHFIFEHIDFSHIRQMEHYSDLMMLNSLSNSIISEALHMYMPRSYINNFENIKSETARIVWNTLHVPLNNLNIILSHLEKKIHEVEFYYPSHYLNPRYIPEIVITEGFIHGFIDMIFMYHDKYYILDWKSNYISEGYSFDLLSKNIKDMHYDLQIMLYTAAVVQWLKTIVPEFSYEHHFGGIFYIYLRGMDINNQGNGVYFYRPNEDITFFNSKKS